MTSNVIRKPSLLWFDRTHDRSTPELMAQFEHACDCKLAKGSTFSSGMQADMICIHFDRPDTPGLRMLLEIKRTAPAIPITMFTVQHSEELAVWAMRSCVWEYMVLPLSAAEKNRYLTAVIQLHELRRNVRDQRKTMQIDHSPTLPGSIRMTPEHQKHQALSNVLLYIDQHFRDNIDQRDVAKRCGMTTFRFSRLFKEAYGLGFMDYILNKRMSFAKELLGNSQMPITSIGYEAGFKDPSYFARAFKHFANCTPSEYRLAHQQLRASVVAELDETTAEVLDNLIHSLGG
ncbi:arabinose operon transcriptional regulator AraC [Pseudomonas sp. FW306-02-F02-AA]|uniref:AraC family transcriptional regulator n=1 Tax=Pseudomonas fluorescens TaxID=294 RepID=A0A0N9WA64_PSEFL|nr:MULTISPECIES: DNA-binding response regulator [Pseudomonas]ALH99804.1 AraC family transcriptional regulator [Pseudomonas fluorescens]PMZ02960.1 arabinose operon transcriptional regulator AraC [Pseudomonas sp. FW306-02-F02-AB]PMZ08566.1 arabinose operon transcriptional regulator AraC [Pseudomonas sp. FW306-02-H06C]PMZ12453.1 arabinose operon transcriptional regulator AraC [Pseudomonas sp. FW306-02-F02-AA]PMZ20656.1 arabinose operon transcriptional regulator AraC [Pseudomonas sp. FW306-02-F08-